VKSPALTISQLSKTYENTQPLVLQLQMLAKYTIAAIGMHTGINWF